MSRYKITLIGCDDQTEFEMDLTEDEFALVMRICDISVQTSVYTCMPTMQIELLEREDEHASSTIG